jgi:hypothetical protein
LTAQSEAQTPKSLQLLLALQSASSARQPQLPPGKLLLQAPKTQSVSTAH